MMAVLHIGGTAPYSQDLTRSRARLLTSIDKFRGGNIASVPTSPIDHGDVAVAPSHDHERRRDHHHVGMIVADLFEGERALQTTQDSSPRS
jgi:hypothetical protein